MPDNQSEAALFKRMDVNFLLGNAHHAVRLGDLRQEWSAWWHLVTGEYPNARLLIKYLDGSDVPNNITAGSLRRGVEAGRIKITLDDGLGTRSIAWLLCDAALYGFRGTQLVLCSDIVPCRVRMDNWTMILDKELWVKATRAGTDGRLRVWVRKDPRIYVDFFMTINVDETMTVRQL
jgi:hypothetical protein